MTMHTDSLPKTTVTTVIAEKIVQGPFFNAAYINNPIVLLL